MTWRSICAWPHPEGGTIGYKCRHLYEESQLSQAEAKLAAGGAAAYVSKLKLKNEDAVVAASLAAAGLKVGRCRLKQAETQYESELVSYMGEPAYAPLFSHSDKWGIPPCASQRLKPYAINCFQFLLST
jgi:hypothetical protein